MLNYFIILWIAIAPFIICGLIGRFLSLNGIVLINTLCNVTNVILSLFVFLHIVYTETILHIILYSWIHVDVIQISIGFILDPLSSAMLVVVSLITFLANIYSIEYMMTDPNKCRFIGYISLFSFFMIFMILSDNLLQFFIGWEGVGICSYLLINFWYSRIQANKASILAILINKLGDIALLLACVMCYFFFKNLNFDFFLDISSLISQLANEEDYTLFESITYIFLLKENYVASLYSICVLLFISAIGKSAQFGFHIWLPEAMEGPTPVSSLIHAATMVTAGIFLILRCSKLYVLFSDILVWIAYLGAVTALFASIIGFFQNDIKKIIAYSTCSQLGYMFMICGLENYNVCFFHLFNHAFFKALLFLIAGYIIHFFIMEQDLRLMSFVLKLSSISYIAFIIGSFSLIGISFFSGFYSKDFIVGKLYFAWLNDLLTVKINSKLLVIKSLVEIAVCFTVVYNFKLIFLIFFNYGNSLKSVIRNVNQNGFLMIVSLFILCILSIVSGYCFHDLMCGIATDFWNSCFHMHAFDIYHEWHKLINSISKIDSRLFDFDLIEISENKKVNKCFYTMDSNDNWTGNTILESEVFNNYYSRIISLYVKLNLHIETFLFNNNISEHPVFNIIYKNYCLKIYTVEPIVWIVLSK